MLSYWEKESFINYDYAIIGSGIVGLSTAISLKEEAPDASIVIFERGLLPTGASTKNAGFACFGSLTELIADVEILGKAKTMELVNERWQGLQKLRSRLSNEELGYLGLGGYELIRESELHFLDALDEINEMLMPLFNKPVFKVVEEQIETLGFDKNYVNSLIYNEFEGQIHTGAMMKSLMKKAQSLDIHIITGAEVAQFEDTKDGVILSVNNLASNSNIDYQCQKLAICTNAFTKKLVPEIDLYPGRGLVLVTQPLEKVPFKGVFHMDQGYYYFRNIGNRIIFGGGRNLDFEVEKSTSFEINKKIEKELHRLLREVIMPNTRFEVDQTWVGIMAFGENKIPIYHQYSSNVWLGVRLGGMGVAIGSRMGEKLAKKML